MKTILAAVLLGVIGIGYADDADIEGARQAWTKAYLEKNGHPVPDSGVKIISQKQQSNSLDSQKQRLKNLMDIKKFGYINRREPKVEQLLTLKITAANDYKHHGSDYKPTNTHLKHSIDELKMAYTFVGVPKNEMSEMIGVAPYLTYLKNQGWVGATQFFVKEGIGICDFSENNVRLSHGAVTIPKEEVRNDVNGKVTTVDVVGTKKSGFLYRVEWYDHSFFRELDCANKEYSEKIKNSVIKLAVKIDNFQ
ncbi:hypothetical protein [Legionella sp. 28fT52]|uniref:hypothetical protein n=1 Tax=Legionella sp. 28fT52 TaxID=3410134 RepID=UPI003AF5FF6E